MEHVPGETLANKLANGALSEKAATALAVQIAEALEDAHARSVVHRDLKPANIMVTPKGQVKLLDFGLAKFLKPAKDLIPSDTTEASQILAGTPPYMAPEQLLGEPADARTDIFAFGTVLYEMSTGQRPFRERSIPGVTDAILHRQPITPRKLNQDISPEFERITLKCLEKERRQRYQSAHELRIELDRLGESAALSNSPEQNTLSVTRSPRKVNHPSRVLLVVSKWAVLLLLAVFVQSKLWPAPIFVDRDWVLIADPENRSPREFLDKTVREGLTIALQQSAYLNVFPRARVIETVRRMGRQDAPRIEESLGREICQRENVRVLLATTIESSGEAFQITVRALRPTGEPLFAEREQFRREEELFERVDSLARRVRRALGESRPRIETSSRPLAKVTTPSLEALQLYSRAIDPIGPSDPENARALLQSALELDRDFAMAHRQLARIYLLAGNRREELEHLTRAYHLRHSVTPREQRLIEADYYTVHGQYEKAAESLEALVSLSPDDQEGQHEAAIAYRNAGDDRKAIAHLREALRLNPFDIHAYSQLLRLLARTNADAEAIEVYQQAIGRDLHSPDLSWGLGLALLGQGKVAEARQEFGRLQEGGRMFENLGRLQLVRTDIYQGKFHSAAKQLKSDIQRDIASGNKSPELLRRYLLARIFLNQGQPESARRELELIVAEGEPEPLQAEDLRRAGTLYARMGEVSAAQDALHKLERLRSTMPTSFNNSCSHNLGGELALALGDTKSALDLFTAAAAEYPRVVSFEGLARVYQAEQDWARAAENWKRVVDARGEILRDFFPADHALAQLELGRMYWRMGDLGRARSQYQEFFKLWAEADELPVRQQALREWREMP
jgi:tetratricopeptide (TPR) repeat protein